jgi:hypothetical protein
MNDTGRNRQDNDEGHNDGGPCCGPELWAECCSDVGNEEPGRFGGADMSSAMAMCFNRCRVFLLFPVILGTAFLLLGYFLSPEVIRVLWMIAAGLMASMALFGAIAMRRIPARSDFPGRCWPCPKQKN